MAELSDIRDAVKTTLEAVITGLTVYPRPPGSVNLPAVLVKPDDANFIQTMARGTDTWELELTVLVSKADDKLGQSKLDPYVTGGGDSSIRKAIFNARTLGLANTDAHISGMTGYSGQYTVADIPYLGAVLRLVVHTQPS